MDARAGVEPALTGPEPAVLPLDDRALAEGARVELARDCARPRVSNPAHCRSDNPQSEMAEGGWSRTPKVLADSSVFKTGAVAHRLAPPWSPIEDLHPGPAGYDAAALSAELMRLGTGDGSRTHTFRGKSPVLCHSSYPSTERLEALTGFAPVFDGLQPPASLLGHSALAPTDGLEPPMTG